MNKNKIHFVCRQLSRCFDKLSSIAWEIYKHLCLCVLFVIPTSAHWRLFCLFCVYISPVFSKGLIVNKELRTEYKLSIFFVSYIYLAVVSNKIRHVLQNGTSEISIAMSRMIRIGYSWGQLAAEKVHGIHAVLQPDHTTHKSPRQIEFDSACVLQTGFYSRLVGELLTDLCSFLY